MSRASYVAYRTDKRFVRRKRELKTIRIMVQLYCQHHHDSKNGIICEECMSLLNYATRRLERCIFGDAKPACSLCVVHCYKREKREHIRDIMRWSGPRMMALHPWLAMCHVLDKFRPVPMHPRKSGYSN